MRAIATSRRNASALCAAALLCLGCVTAAERLQRFEGRPVSELIAARGPADRIVGYPFGGRVYIWEEERTTPTSPDATGRRAPTGQAQATQVFRAMALVGDDGIVSRTHVENAPKGSTPQPF
jgi:hypothetical protein